MIIKSKRQFTWSYILYTYSKVALEVNSKIKKMLATNMTDDEIKLTFCLKVIEINRIEYK